MGNALDLTRRGAAVHRSSGAAMKQRDASAMRPAAAAVITAVVILASGCSGGSSPNATAGASGSTSAVAYSSCVRSHGVPNYPDPGPSGQVPKPDPQLYDVSTTQLNTALRACQSLTPTAGETSEQQQETQCALAYDCTQAVVQPWMSGLRTLAACLRAHGEPNWPDPILTSQGIPHFDYTSTGIDHHSPAVWNKVQRCITLTGFQGLPLP
jgi:hypothetical protein